MRGKEKREMEIEELINRLTPYLVVFLVLGVGRIIKEAKRLLNGSATDIWGWIYRILRDVMIIFLLLMILVYLDDGFMNIRGKLASYGNNTTERLRLMNIELTEINEGIGENTLIYKLEY